jgi:hypothetical protein
MISYIVFYRFIVAILLLKIKFKINKMGRTKKGCLSSSSDRKKNENRSSRGAVKLINEAQGTSATTIMDQGPSVAFNGMN